MEDQSRRDTAGGQPSTTENRTSNNRSRLIGVEIAAAMFGFCNGLQSVITVNLCIDKICQNNLNYSEELCSNLVYNKNSTIQDEVQVDASNISMYSTLLVSVPSVIISFIIGPLSDRFGRKIPLIIPLIGMLIGMAVNILNVYFWSAKVEFILLGNISALFGSYTCFAIGLYSFTVDTSSEDTRTTRISILDASVSSSTSLGTFLSAYIFSYIGYYGIYMTAGCIFLLDLLFVVFFLNNIRHHSESTLCESLASTCSPSMFRAVVRKRSGYKRMKLIIMFSTMLVFCSIYAGDFNYLYTRKVLNWDEQIYTKISAFGKILTCVGSMMILPVMSYYMRLPDPLIGWIASCSLIGTMLFTALARTSDVYTYGVIIGALGDVLSSTIRSIMSKQVKKDELGKVYSLLGCLEGLLPLFVTPLATLIYNDTLDRPSTIFFIRTAMAILISMVFVFIGSLERRNKTSVTLASEPGEQTPLLL